MGLVTPAGAARRRFSSASASRAASARPPSALGMSRPVTWGVRERSDGLRLEADDVGWTHGSGPVVRGPYDALLLALGGRSAGLSHHSGDGVDLLAPRVTHAL